MYEIKTLSPVINGRYSITISLEILEHLLFFYLYIAIMSVFLSLQLVKLHSVKIKGPADKGPKTVKLFINQPRTLDFDQAAGNSSVQDLE